jgi:hypothetical protein
MSRFLVLVIGEHPESQLTQYSSFENAQYRNHYMKIIDETDKAKSEYDSGVHASLNEHMLEYCAELGMRKLDSFGSPNFTTLHRNGYYTLDANGDVNLIMHRYNENSQCCHFELGGGWAGFYQVKSDCRGLETGKNRTGTPFPKPRTSDRLLKGDIDFKRMKKEAGLSAAYRYDTYVEMKNKHGGTDSEAFKNEFSTFLQSENCFPIFDIGEYEVEKDTFVHSRELRCISAFAFLKEGVWHEREAPNWTPEAVLPLTELEWLELTWAILDALPDNTQFSMFECLC